MFKFTLWESTYVNCGLNCIVLNCVDCFYADIVHGLCSTEVFLLSVSLTLSAFSFLISETFCLLPCRTSEPAWTIWTVCWKWKQRTRPPWSSCRKCRRRNEDRSGTRGSSKDVSLLWVQEAKVIFFYKNQLVENSRTVTWFYCLWVQDQARVSQNSFTEFLFDVFTLTWTDMKLVSRCL